MGYSTTFRLKGELDNKFKTWMTMYKKSDESKYKVILEAVCMKPFDGLEGKETWILHKVYDKVHSAVQFYVRMLVENWKVCIANRLKEKNNRITFYGWEYSSNRDCPWESEDDLVDYFTEDLFMLAINEAQKPFGGKTNKDDEEWYEKWQKIKDTTNGIEESVTSFMNNQFIERYRDSEDADEDDGCDHRFPENEGKDWYDLDEDETDEEPDSSDEANSDDNEDVEADRIRDKINKNLEETAKSLETSNVAVDDDNVSENPVTYALNDPQKALEVKYPDLAADKSHNGSKTIKKDDRGK